MATVATKRKGKNGWFSDLVGPKTTIRHVKTGAVSTSKSRYKGYTIFKEKSGDFSIPGLDKSSAFDSLRDAKRFVDFQTKKGMVNPVNYVINRVSGDRYELRYKTGKSAERVGTYATHADAEAARKLHWAAQKKNPKRNAAGGNTRTRTATEVRSPTKTSTSTDAYTSGNVTVTGGAGRGATTSVKIYQKKPTDPDVRTAGPQRGTRANGRFAAIGTTGRKKSRSNPDEHVASMSIGGAAAQVYRTTSNAFKAVVKWGKQTSEKVFKGFGQAMNWARDQVQKLAVGKAKNVDPFTAASAVGTYGPKVGKALDKAGSKLEKQLGKIKLSNPMDSATRLYEEFHGLPSEEVLEYVQKEHYHSVLSGLGPLISMKVLNVFGNAEMTLEFPDPMDAEFTRVVQLCSSENGRQLYLVGGDQELALNKLKGAFGMTGEDIRDKMLIGTITQITYRTRKAFELGGKEEIDFFHDLDDDDALKQNDGVLPVLEYRPLNPSIEVVGGRYKIAKGTKELDGVSPGIVG